MLIELGEDSGREGLARTPRRVAESMRFLTAGYRGDTRKLIRNACFSRRIDNMIIVKDIEIYGPCEHHLLPFFGRCHVG